MRVVSVAAGFGTASSVKLGPCSRRGPLTVAALVSDLCSNELSLAELAASAASEDLRSSKVLLVAEACCCAGPAKGHPAGTKALGTKDGSVPLEWLPIASLEAAAVGGIAEAPPLGT